MMKMENSLGLASYDDKSRENTGRWTKEEHNLFLKGLELHGKGWKKIASLIKSRTVVQIRTHAQKYFLKLQKARHDGASGGYNDGRSNGYRKSKKRKFNDFPISLAHCLKPFIRSPTCTEDIETLNDTLYNFLSPQLDIYPSTSDESDRSSNYESKYSNKKSTNNTNGANIPSWYKNGESLASLIELAEKLNWIHDIGTPIADINLTNTMSPEIFEGTKPAVVLLPSPAVTSIPSFYSNKSSVSSTINNNSTHTNSNNSYTNINCVPSSSTSFSSDLAITSSPPRLTDSLDHHDLNAASYNNNFNNNTFEEFIQNQNWMINYAPASIELSTVIDTLSEHEHEDDLNSFGEGCVAYPECLQVF